MKSSCEVVNQSSGLLPLSYVFMSSDTYPPFRVDVTVLFGEEMAERGHNIDWILQSSEKCERSCELEWNNWTVCVGSTDLGTSRIRRMRKHFLDWKNDYLIFHLVAKHRYDFIQVKDKFVAALMGIVAARRNKCAFVYWLSYPYPEASLYAAKIGTARYRFLFWLRGHAFKFILYKIIARYADHIFVQSEQMKRDFLLEGVPSSIITAVPMGYSPESTLNFIPEDVGDIGPLSIVYIGTLLKTRRFDFMVRVLARVVEEIPDVVLYMVGPEELPGDADVLLDEARRLKVSDNLVLTGRLERHLALSYVAEAGVCVSPFFPTPVLNSTSPTKLIEYMALKKAVVANEHPEQLQVITESGGGICVKYDEKPFAEAIITLLHDPKKAEKMGKCGFEYVQQHRTYSRIAERVESSYRAMLNNKVSAD